MEALLLLLIIAVRAKELIKLDFGDTHVTVMVGSSPVRINNTVSFLPGNRRYVGISNSQNASWQTADVRGLVCRSPSDVEGLVDRNATVFEETLGFNLSFYKVPNLEFADVPSRAKAGFFSADELQAMVFEHASLTYHSRAENSGSQAAMVVPAWFSPLQRKQLFSIARLGGFDIVVMASEVASAAMGVHPRPNGQFLVVSVGNSAKVGVFRYINETLYTEFETWRLDLGAKLSRCEEVVKLEPLVESKRDKGAEVCLECSSVIDEVVGLIKEAVAQLEIENQAYEVYVLGGNSDLICLIERIENFYAGDVKVINETTVLRGLDFANKSMHGPYYSVMGIVRAQEKVLVSYELFASFGASDKMRVEEIVAEDDLEIEISCIDIFSNGTIHGSKFDIYGVFDAISELKKSNIEGYRIRIVYFMDPIGLPVVANADILYEDEKNETNSIKLNVVHSYESELSLVEKPAEYNRTSNLMEAILNYEIEEGKKERNKELLDIGIKRALTIEESELFPYGQPEEIKKLKEYAEKLQSVFEEEPLVLENIHEKIDKLNSLYRPLVERMEHHKNREAIVRITSEKLDDAYERFKKLQKHKPWLPVQLVVAIDKFILEGKNWFEDQVELQKSRPINKDPLFTPNQLTTLLDRILGKVEQLAQLEKKDDQTKMRTSHLVKVDA